MIVATKPRGATAFSNTSPRLPKKHLLGAVFLVSVVALLLLVPTEKAASPALPRTGDDVRHELAKADSATFTLEEIVPQASPIVPALPTLPALPSWDEREVRSGDTLSAIFNRAGFNDRDLHEVVKQAPDGKALARIHPGQTIAFQAADDGTLSAVRHIKSRLETTEYRRFDSGFSSEKLQRQPQVKENWATGEITSSLFLAGQKAGMSQNLIMEMANIFGGVIDFALDPRKGDTMQLIFNELYLDGEKYRDGDILAASFTNKGKAFDAYRYQDSHGETGYFNEEGVSMRKAFLLAPVDFTRISSNFNPKRLHPIYKTTRPHRGTDYAAPRGTPVFSAGDGKVIKAGYTRANGNYVFIQHGQQYVTRYLHLHKRRVKKGQRVSQNQVIGTVGATGSATGPHLHYEFLVNGVHRNPRTIHKSLPKAKTLPAAEMPRFRNAIAQASDQLTALRKDEPMVVQESSRSPTAASSAAP